MPKIKVKTTHLHIYPQGPFPRKCITCGELEALAPGPTSVTPEVSILKQDIKNSKKDIRECRAEIDFIEKNITIHEVRIMALQARLKELKS